MPNIALNTSVKEKFYDNFSSIKSVVLTHEKQTHYQSSDDLIKKAKMNDLKWVNKHHFEDSQFSSWRLGDSIHLPIYKK